MTSSIDKDVANQRDQYRTPRQEFPNAAQLQREADIRSQIVTSLSKSFNLRIKSVELAAQFKSDDPMKLAREIYKFLSDTEV